MTFARLYNEVQKKQGRISTKWLRQRVAKLSTITHVREMWSSLVDPIHLRGFYVEGPMGPPIPRDTNQSLIGLSREMCTGPNARGWRRFVFTKELMHCFDTPAEKTDTPEKFDAQIRRFRDPTVPPSAQSQSEAFAYYRALAVLCPSASRKSLAERISKKEISYDVAAAALDIPVSIVSDLFSDDFETILKKLV